MKKLAIMCSSDTQLTEAVVKYLQNKGDFEITLLSDDMNSEIFEKAKKYGIKAKYLPFEQSGCHFSVNNYDLIAMAGYTQELSEEVLNLGRFVNLHPSLLPAFHGKNAVFRAYEAGVKVSGVTVHYLTADIDGGKIIAQYPVLIGNLMHFDEYETQVKSLACHLYPIVIEKILKDEVFDFSDFMGGCGSDGGCGSCGGTCGGCH